MVDGRATNLLIQFAREPVQGRVKTRMMPHLSAAQACSLHQQLVLWTCDRLLASGLGEVELCVAGDVDHPCFKQCRALGNMTVTQQRGADLGERMYLAIRQGLRHYEKVLLVGSDCPSIDAGYLGAALQGLDDQPLVLGPALDGGYVLVGGRQIGEAMFHGISWGSDQVYRQTVNQLRREGLEWHELPMMADVDRPADLALWQALSAGRG